MCSYHLLCLCHSFLFSRPKFNRVNRLMLLFFRVPQKSRLTYEKKHTALHVKMLTVRAYGVYKFDDLVAREQTALSRPSAIVLAAALLKFWGNFAFGFECQAPDRPLCLSWVAVDRFCFLYVFYCSATLKDIISPVINWVHISVSYL